jgi:predicted nucleotidyltransferase component of viral defense system
LKPVKSRNTAASVRQKLLNLATSTGEDFGLVLTRYVLERLLYRLSQSKYRDQFILKGAMLFQVWSRTPHRPTRDLDLLGRGDPSIEYCQEVFGELCRIRVEDDGLIFSAETVKAEKIKEEQDYDGVRVKFLTRLDNARIPLQVDVGFGDAVNSGLLDYPTLLPMPAPRVLAYPMNAVVAEKLEAIVNLGMVNSRMKDFYDIWFLARTFPFQSEALGAAKSHIRTAQNGAGP